MGSSGWLHLHRYHLRQPTSPRFWKALFPIETSYLHETAAPSPLEYGAGPAPVPSLHESHRSVPSVSLPNKTITITSENQTAGTAFRISPKTHHHLQSSLDSSVPNVFRYLEKHVQLADFA